MGGLGLILAGSGLIWLRLIDVSFRGLTYPFGWLWLTSLAANVLGLLESFIDHFLVLNIDLVDKLFVSEEARLQKR